MGMIALIPHPDDAAQLAVDGGDPAADMHLTLSYMGDDDESIAPAQVDALRADLAELAANHPAIQAEAFAHAHFNPAGVNSKGEPSDPCMVYLVNGELGDLRDQALQLGATHVPHAPDPYPSYIPHITAGYGLDQSALSYTGPVRFNAIRLDVGDTVEDYPMQPTAAEAKPLPDPALEPAGEIPVEFPVIVIEGMRTDDGRFIEPGALTHRALPLPILAQNQNPDGGEGHDGAAVIGALRTLERVPGPEVISKETGAPFPEGTFVWRGTGGIAGDSAHADMAMRGYLRGNSVDLVDTAVELVIADAEDEDDPEGVLMSADGTEARLKRGKIAATTLVPVPAFADGYVVIAGQQMAAADEEGLVASPMWRSSELGDDTCAPCLAEAADVPQAKRDKATDAGHAMPDGSYPIETPEDLDNAIHAVGRAGGPGAPESEHDAVRAHIIKQAKRLNLVDRIPANWNPDGTLKPAVTASTLAAYPLAYFQDPGFGEPTAMHVEPDTGRVYGHIATWGTCHTGFTGKCVLAPKTKTNYGLFTLGSVLAKDQDGSTVEVPVGHLTVGTGHAATDLGAHATVEHYDNTGTAAADVALGEDRHGIWAAGVVRPGTPAEKVHALRASPISGDWRWIDGNLELVAALAVNVPGFPVPRARVASGVVTALVAAGVLPSDPGSSSLAEQAAADRVAADVVATLGVGDELSQRHEAASASLGQLRLAARRQAALMALHRR
jgi:2'-5' RNA ligase